MHHTPTQWSTARCTTHLHSDQQQGAPHTYTAINSKVHHTPTQQSTARYTTPKQQSTARCTTHLHSNRQPWQYICSTTPTKTVATRAGLTHSSVRQVHTDTLEGESVVADFDADGQAVDLCMALSVLCCRRSSYWRRGRPSTRCCRQVPSCPATPWCSPSCAPPSQARCRGPRTSCSVAPCTISPCGRTADDAMRHHCVFVMCLGSWGLGGGGRGGGGGGGGRRGKWTSGYWCGLECSIFHWLFSYCVCMFACVCVCAHARGRKVFACMFYHPALSGVLIRWVTALNAGLLTLLSRNVSSFLYYY